MRLMSAIAIVMLLAAPAAAARLWVVDSGGTGDFLSIQEAVDAAAPGDTVHVMARAAPYAAAIVSKPLHVVGRELVGPWPTVAAMTVHDVPYCTLANLAIVALEVRDVPGLAVIDRCHLGAAGSGNTPRRIVRAGDVVVSRTWSRAGLADAVFDGPFAVAGLEVVDSDVTIVQSTLEGTRAFAGTAPFAQAGAGLDATRSLVLSAGSSSFGGDGLPQPPPAASALPGPGTRAVDSLVDVRGAPNHQVHGGAPGAPSIDATGSIVVASGVTIAHAAPGVLAHVGVVPYLHPIGTGELGTAIGAHVFGEANEFAFLAVGIGSASLPLAGLLHGVLGIEPAGVLAIEPVLLAGLDTPSPVMLSVPPWPALRGVRVLFQAFQPRSDGSWFPTNRVALPLH